MSVDCSARIVYGYTMTYDEFQEYSKRCIEAGYDEWEDCRRVNEYDAYSDIVYGVIIESTSSYTAINFSEMFKIDNDENIVIKTWKELMPERADEEPAYYLVSNWW